MIIRVMIIRVMIIRVMFIRVMFIRVMFISELAVNRRNILTCLCGLAMSGSVSRVGAKPKVSLADIPLSVHEAAMRKAIAAAKGNPVYPFGAVITKASTGELMASGVNAAGSNPTYHGEIACINNYITRHGNKGWDEMILYTTGEPCAMCMSALCWSGVGGVVYASSIATIGKAGMGQISISAKDVIAAANFWNPDLLGGVLADECDAMFMNRQRN